MWFGGVVDTQTDPKPPQITPKITLFDPNFGRFTDLEKLSPKKTVLFFSDKISIHQPASHKLKLFLYFAHVFVSFCIFMPIVQLRQAQNV